MILERKIEVIISFRLVKIKKKNLHSFELVAPCVALDCYDEDFREHLNRHVGYFTADELAIATR